MLLCFQYIYTKEFSIPKIRFIPQVIRFGLLKWIIFSYFHYRFQGDISTVKTICPPGYFCPNGTGADWRACPPGTYSDIPGRSEERECTPCDPGKFCRGSNLTAPNGDCQEGYYCSRGAAVPNPVMTNLTYCPAHFVHVTVGDICPRGHFCPGRSDMYQGMLL